MILILKKNSGKKKEKENRNLRFFLEVNKGRPNLKGKGERAIPLHLFNRSFVFFFVDCPSPPFYLILTLDLWFLVLKSSLAFCLH